MEAKDTVGELFEMDEKGCFHIWSTYYAHTCDLEIVTRCIKCHTIKEELANPTIYQALKAYQLANKCHNDEEAKLFDMGRTALGEYC